MSERFETFTFLIASINKSIHRIKSEFMEEVGLRSSHVHLLYYLATRGPMSIKQLTELCLDDKANLSRTAATLEEMGYVRRESRGRRVTFSLTDEGSALGERISGGIERVLSISANGLTPEERDTMYSALSRVNENLISYSPIVTKPKEGEENE